MPFIMSKFLYSSGTSSVSRHLTSCMQIEGRCLLAKGGAGACLYPAYAVRDMAKHKHMPIWYGRICTYLLQLRL